MSVATTLQLFLTYVYISPRAQMSLKIVAFMESVGIPYNNYGVSHRTTQLVIDQSGQLFL